MVALVASLLITLHSIEQTFNSIWRVAAARPKVTRFLIYWTVLTLGTMLAAASMAMAAYVFALPLFRTTEGQWLAEFAWRLAPMAVEFICIVLIYRVVPQHVVRLRHALPGALLAVILMEIVKWGFGVYLGNFQTYQRIYGALSALPILLLWIYLSWVSVLLGASLASSMAAFRYQPRPCGCRRALRSMACCVCLAGSARRASMVKAWTKTAFWRWNPCSPIR